MNRRIKLPLTSTPNNIQPVKRIKIAPAVAIIDGAESFPIINSNILIGDTVICSTVFRSFSRTIESEVAITAIIIRMKAINPGIKKLAVFNCGLYHTLGTSSTFANLNSFELNCFNLSIE